MKWVEQTIEYYKSQNYIVYKLIKESMTAVLFHKEKNNTFIYGIIQTDNINELDIGFLIFETSNVSLGCSEMINQENGFFVGDIDKKINKIEQELIKIIKTDYLDSEMCPKVAFEKPTKVVEQFALTNSYKLIIA